MAEEQPKKSASKKSPKKVEKVVGDNFKKDEVQCPSCFGNDDFCPDCNGTGRVKGNK